MAADSVAGSAAGGGLVAIARHQINCSIEGKIEE